MDFSLTDEQQLIGNARRFVQSEIVPFEDHLDPDAGALDPKTTTSCRQDKEHGLLRFRHSGGIRRPGLGYNNSR